MADRAGLENQTLAAHEAEVGKARVTFYNDNDPKVAAWLRELVRQGHLPGGPVDERSIAELVGGDCAPTSHFFAGIGGWPLALARAGWPEHRDVWTGSCPCQPFSVAGKGRGTADERHLWPDFLRLIAECKPATIFGEQVASKAGRDWLDGVRADLEALGYAVGAADLCAAGAGAPHIRQRLFWVAHSECGNVGRDRPGQNRMVEGREAISQGHGDTNADNACGCGTTQRMAEPQGVEHDGSGNTRGRRGELADGGGMGNPDDQGSQGRVERGDSSGERFVGTASVGAWSDYELIPCADGKSRRVESGTFPLAHGVPARVVRLRGYGNGIVPDLAAAFVQAFLEAECLT